MPSSGDTFKNSALFLITNPSVFRILKICTNLHYTSFSGPLVTVLIPNLGSHQKLPAVLCAQRCEDYLAAQLSFRKLCLWVVLPDHRLHSALKGSEHFPFQQTCLFSRFSSSFGLVSPETQNSKVLSWALGLCYCVTLDWFWCRL